MVNSMEPTEQQQQDTESQRAAAEAEALVAAVSNAQNLRFDVVSRTIYLWCDIDHESAGQFIVNLMTVDQTPGPIRVIMNSHGGDTTSGMAIYDSIKAARNTVSIDAYGACQSVAAIIFQAAGVRRLSRNCEFMIHDCSVDMSEAGSQSALDLELMKQSVAASNKLLHRILAVRSGIPLQKIKKLCQQDYRLTAGQAVKMGFADAIIRSTP